MAQTSTDFYGPHLLGRKPMPGEICTSVELPLPRALVRALGRVRS